VAQLPLKVYTRDGADRHRDRDSVAARVLWRPNPDQTEYEFICALFTELKVFGNVFVWVVPDANTETGIQLRIIPTDWVMSTSKANSYAPESIVVRAKNGRQIEIPSTEFVQFRTYSPGNPGGYVSPISALRQTLEEQIHASKFRTQLWRSSGRLNAQIIRPANVEPWDEETRRNWVEQFREAWGAGGSKAGSIPVMEDGMEIKPFSTSFKEAEWASSITLTREAVAAAYRVNPSLIWHSNTQTYASSKDNARALYAECLGPDLQMIQQRINSFLLPMLGADPAQTYVEFDLTEKLKGSFEERASILQSSVGGPWLTRNEARADNNLPPIEGGDQLIVPLNVIEGGQASPTDTHMDTWASTQPETKAFEIHKKAKTTKVIASEKEEDAVSDALSAYFKRQAKSVIAKVGAKSESWWNDERWNKELADDLEPVLKAISDAHGMSMAELLGTEFHPEATVNYIRKLAEAQAIAINAATLKKLKEALQRRQEAEEEEEELDEDPVVHEFEERSTAEALLMGAMLAKRMAGWGSEEAADQATRQGSRKYVYKRWDTGPNARPEHDLMDGETVPIYESFSNGADWPGDDVLGPEGTCGCNCTTTIIVEER
jgi:HK97 family phage portal protein